MFEESAGMPTGLWTGVGAGGGFLCNLNCAAITAEDTEATHFHAKPKRCGWRVLQRVFVVYILPREVPVLLLFWDQDLMFNTFYLFI